MHQCSAWGCLNERQASGRRPAAAPTICNISILCCRFVLGRGEALWHASATDVAHWRAFDGALVAWMTLWWLPGAQPAPRRYLQAARVDVGQYRQTWRGRVIRGARRNSSRDAADLRRRGAARPAVLARCDELRRTANAPEPP